MFMIRISVLSKISRSILLALFAVLFAFSPVMPALIAHAEGEPSISFISPTNGDTVLVGEWAPSIDWGDATTCGYYYNYNFEDPTTADCSLGGSDIPPPNSTGNYSLYIVADMAQIP